MVAAVFRRVRLWLLSVIGVFAFIIITCSEASSMVNSLDAVKVVNGSGHKGSTATTHVDRLEKPSFSCSKRLCVAELKSSKNSSRSLRFTKSEKDVMFSRKSKNSNFKHNSTDMTNSDYLPVHYETYGYHNEQSVVEGRSLVTTSLFIFFSIIQFKLVTAILLAFFGPMIMFMLIVQGFIFKATLVLLGLMMIPA